MPTHAHRLSLTVNALFLMAGGVHSLANTALYRIAVVIILLLLHALWMRSVVRRTARQAINCYRAAHHGD